MLGVGRDGPLRLGLAFRCAHLHMKRTLGFPFKLWHDLGGAMDRGRSCWDCGRCGHRGRLMLRDGSVSCRGGLRAGELGPLSEAPRARRRRCCRCHLGLKL